MRKSPFSRPAEGVGDPLKTRERTMRTRVSVTWYLDVVHTFDCFDCYGIELGLKSESVVLFTFFFCFNVMLMTCSCLSFHVDMRIGFSLCAKRVFGILIGIVLSVKIALGSIVILAIFFPVRGHGRLN